MSEWTDELAHSYEGIDAIEVAGIDEMGGWIDDGTPATSWSVFVHAPGVGAVDVADRDTIDGARDYAETLAAHYGVPVHDFA